MQIISLLILLSGENKLKHFDRNYFLYAVNTQKNKNKKNTRIPYPL